MCRKADNLSQFQDAFNPEPLKSPEELNTFYLNTALARTGDEYSDFVNNLSLQLEDCTEVCLHKLFIGHPGCGKTTELFQLMNKTNELGFFTCIGRCDLELDSADIEYTDVLFLILDLLLRKAEDEEMKISQEVVEEIYDYWNNETEIVEAVLTQQELAGETTIKAKLGLANVISIMGRIKGVIKNSSDSRTEIRKHIEPKSSELVNKIKRVIEILSDECEKKGKKKNPVIILDGLDKIPLEQARKIFRENGARFSLLNVHLIVTFPIALTYTPEYSDIQTWFPNPEKLPMIKLRKWDNDHYVEPYTAGIETMRKIVLKRANASLFEKGVLDNLIKSTGGYIRDLFRCIARAAIRARSRQSGTISMEDAKNALNNLESDINGRYSDGLISTMRKIYEGEKFVSSSSEMTQLLQIGAVLEYNGQRWCDLHPLVEKWLLEHGKIESSN